MYAAEVAEKGGVEQICQEAPSPIHWGIMGSLRGSSRRRAPVQIKGQPPVEINPPKGCRFHPRCRT